MSFQIVEHVYILGTMYPLASDKVRVPEVDSDGWSPSEVAALLKAIMMGHPGETTFWQAVADAVNQVSFEKWPGTYCWGEIL